MSGPIETNVSGNTPKIVNASYQSGVVSVGTTATLIAVIPEGYNGGVVVTAAATGVFVGGSGVTGSTNGFPLPNGTPVTIPGGKSGERALYGTVGSAGTATNVSYILAAD
ncbi:hypothetical protein E2F47_23560 [Mycobacterium eburneum]|nr:hypothetical protein [Mycobacterium eburneum]TDH48497.1 hypothetical protein E2F47_23560 [Mycobacterium eburneum]